MKWHSTAMMDFQIGAGLVWESRVSNVEYES